MSWLILGLKALVGGVFVLLIGGAYVILMLGVLAFFRGPKR